MYRQRKVQNTFNEGDPKIFIRCGSTHRLLVQCRACRGPRPYESVFSTRNCKSGLYGPSLMGSSGPSHIATITLNLTIDKRELAFSGRFLAFMQKLLRLFPCAKISKNNLVISSKSYDLQSSQLAGMNGPNATSWIQEEGLQVKIKIKRIYKKRGK